MTIDPNRIREMYSGISTRHYDLPISHIYGKYRKLAFKESSLKNGDKVLVFCCGTGLDFPHILKKIGKEGEIIGVDFSSEMLRLAQNKIRRKKWDNVKLINADVTKFRDEFDEKFDAGVCTLGISIIPDYKAAYNNLLSYIKPHGEVIIGDAQLASGWLARFNPLTIFLARRYGGSYEGHKNSLEICERMKRKLTGVIKREFFLNSYFYCIGKTK
jgi:demethylmenaquinone methyltransferase/2-methoxy-6-polyprenyl-1,4-benzoquinol methylase